MTTRLFLLLAAVCGAIVALCLFLFWFLFFVFFFFVIAFQSNCRQRRLMFLIGLTWCVGSAQCVHNIYWRYVIKNAYILIRLLHTITSTISPLLFFSSVWIVAINLSISTSFNSFFLCCAINFGNVQWSHSLSLIICSNVYCKLAYLTLHSEYRFWYASKNHGRICSIVEFQLRFHIFIGIQEFFKFSEKPKYFDINLFDSLVNWIIQ